MPKVFNVTADCKPADHYMVSIDDRLRKIKEMVDAGKYFTINRARQYGKTTILRGLDRYLRNKYYVVLMDFQRISSAKFSNENTFSLTFAKTFLRLLERNDLLMTGELKEALARFRKKADGGQENFELTELFEEITHLCEISDKPMVLMIDEVDSATNNQVFLDFLAQLRACFIDRDIQPAFQSVILAGVYDVKNLKRKLRPEDEHKINSPWNIAADFKVDMDFSKEDIAGMLQEYEKDYDTGMDIGEVSGILYDYTSGYPFLVSWLCRLLDEEIVGTAGFRDKRDAWTRSGINEAVRLVLSKKSTLFESLVEKLTSYPEMDSMLRSMLFVGRSISYNSDDPVIDMATMFGFIKNQQGTVAVANRIFETRLYNLYLSADEMQRNEIYKASIMEKSQFIKEGHLNMRRVLEKFVLHFNDLYGDSDEDFLEDVGRKYFLLYLRPIINGTGNYYIESQTRGFRRTDVIVDYLGEQFIIEMKIWHGEEYNHRGEEQLAGYLENYHMNTGYMVSFNFNRKKQTGVHEIIVGDKRLIEAVV